MNNLFSQCFSSEIIFLTTLRFLSHVSMNRQLKRPLKPRSRDVPRIMFNRPSTHIRQPNRRRNRLLISIAGYFFSCLASRLPRTCRNWQRLHGCTHVCTYYTQASHAPYRIARVSHAYRESAKRTLMITPTNE